MENLLGVLALISFCCLILGMIKPSIVVRWGEKRTRSKAFLYYGGIFLVAAIIGSAISPGPLELTLTTPRDKELVTHESIPVCGIVSKKADIYINGEKIKLSQEGNQFSRQFPLVMGENRIVVKAISGKETDEAVIIVTRTSQEELARIKAEKEAEKKRLEAEERREEAERIEKERLARMIGEPDQYKFHEELKELEEKYKGASNEIKKSKVAREFREFCLTYLGNLRFHGWKGSLKDIGTTESGKKAYIQIQSRHAGKTIRYQTWNNQISDAFTNSMLVLGTKVYKQVENLSIGDEVVFSGSFVHDNDRGVAEQSLTEEGWVTDPEFTIEFSDIQKVE